MTLKPSSIGKEMPKIKLTPGKPGKPGKPGGPAPSK
jgi:hypothetical protein